MNRLVFIVLLLLTIAGCAEPGPVLVPVRGKATYHGQPIPKAQMVFHPQFDGPGWMPVAVVGPDGTFEASTKMAGDGVLPGLYKVTVVWHPQANDDGDGRNFLPIKYAAPATTPLEIKAGSDNSQPVTIDLQD